MYTLSALLLTSLLLSAPAMAQRFVPVDPVPQPTGHGVAAGLQFKDICYGTYRGAPAVEMEAMPTIVSCGDYDREHGTHYDRDSAKAWLSGPSGYVVQQGALVKSRS